MNEYSTSAYMCNYHSDVLMCRIMNAFFLKKIEDIVISAVSSLSTQGPA